jgi:hypothetical protein
MVRKHLEGVSGLETSLTRPQAALANTVPAVD